MTIVGTHVLAQSSDSSFFYGDDLTQNPNTSINTVIKEDVANASDGVLKQILTVFNLNRFVAMSNSSALEFAKYIINIALWLVTFIALIVILYGFAQIFFAKDDDGLSKAKNIVRWAAIAIAIIAVSWFIVTFLFNIYEQFIS